MDPAHIGVAMGKKELKSQIMANFVDDLSKMIVAVSAGRRIYTNLKKQFNISFPYTFLLYLRLHYLCFLDGYILIFSLQFMRIFLELVMGPMCSIVYENEPAEKQYATNATRYFFIIQRNGN
jgi:Ca2+-transporting ATPase